LKLIAQALEEEVFLASHWSEGMQERKLMNHAVAKVIDDEYAPVATQYFHQCITESAFIELQMRTTYHEVRRGHLAIYADVLEQVRQEPTFPELQRRSDKLVADCEKIGRRQEQCADTVSGLLETGQAVQQRFNVLVDTIASKTGAKFHTAPRKGLFRIFEKITLTPGPNQGRPEKICDLVRGALECDNFITVQSVLRLMCDLDGDLKITGETGGIDDRICITRCKGRFGKPTSGGWADIMVNFFFENDDQQHICEVQLVHAQLYNVRTKMGAHRSYQVFRASLELLTMNNCDPEENAPAADTRALKALLWTDQIEGSWRLTGRMVSPLQCVGVDSHRGGVEESSSSSARNDEKGALQATVKSLERQVMFQNSEVTALKATSKLRDAELVAMKVFTVSFSRFFSLQRHYFNFNFNTISSTSTICLPIFEIHTSASV
jgi:hypothetical protein